MSQVYPVPEFVAERCFINDDQYQAMYERSGTANKPLDEGLRKGLEASIRKTKFKGRVATLRARIRDGVAITVGRPGKR